jgi:hypothetical protein
MAVRGSGSALVLQIIGTDLPGLRCAAGEGFEARDAVHVAVQRKDRPDELLDPQPANADRVSWSFPCAVTSGAAGLPLCGRYVQDRIGGGFVYLSWVSLAPEGTAAVFRRGRLMLDAVPEALLAEAVERGQLRARLSLTGADGLAAGARLVPPLVQWSAEPAP